MWKPLLLIFLVILTGTIGYSIIENLNVLDSLYMTIITIFTVGFREMRQPLSDAGQIFTIFIILSGVGTAIVGFTKLAEIAFGGGFYASWRRRAMQKKLENIRDHFIICGRGRMGQIVREQLESEKLPFVIIDIDPKKTEDLSQSQHCLYIQGDAGQEEILIKAGIKRARALAALLPDDADNLYLTFTSKLLNPSLFVLAKALDEEGEKKILQIGANKVVSPYKLSALKIAQGLIRPALVDFMDLIIRRQELSLIMEQLVVKKNSKIAGRSLTQCQLRSRANVIVVAIKKPGEDIVFNPQPNVNIEAGDTLLVMGNLTDIQQFEKTYIRKENDKQAP